MLRFWGTKTKTNVEYFKNFVEQGYLILRVFRILLCMDYVLNNTWHLDTCRILNWQDECHGGRIISFLLDSCEGWPVLNHGLI